MATLRSEETLIPSFIRLLFADEVRDGGRWLGYSLELGSGDRRSWLRDEGNEIGRCLFAREPFDEAERLMRGLERFLAGEPEWSFEPQEPNFELLLRREALGFSAYCFIDAGNQRFDHATWDGFGLRMFTTRVHLEDFLAQLIEEHAIAVQAVRKGSG